MLNEEFYRKQLADEWPEERACAAAHFRGVWCTHEGYDVEDCRDCMKESFAWLFEKVFDAEKNRVEEGPQKKQSFMTDYIIKAQALEAILTSGELSGEAWAAAYNSIKSIPAVDAAPVIHAPVSHRSFDDYEGRWQTCGKCNYENNTEDAIYCGGCGAKLDGEYKEY